MKNKSIILLIILCAFLFSCDLDKPENIELTHFHFPIGRSHLGEHEVKFKINGSEEQANIYFDKMGSYWIKLAIEDLPVPAEITIDYIRRNQEINLYKEDDLNIEQYLLPSLYINSNSTTIQEKANELCKGLSTNIEKAIRIKNFVRSHLRFNKDLRLASLHTASDTYHYKEGICINFSRLSTALCRAAGVPARTVWGIVYNYHDNGLYNFHHQWTEILDEAGYWHPFDNSYSNDFDLNSLKYLDLLYAPEQNRIIIDSSPQNEFILGDMLFIDCYPSPIHGRINHFTLIEDERPDFMTVQLKFEYTGDKLKEISNPIRF